MIQDFTFLSGSCLLCFPCFPSVGDHSFSAALHIKVGMMMKFASLSWEPATETLCFATFAPLWIAVLHARKRSIRWMHRGGHRRVIRAPVRSGELRLWRRMSGPAEWRSSGEIRSRSWYHERRSGKRVLRGVQIYWRLARRMNW